MLLRVTVYTVHAWHCKMREMPCVMSLNRLANAECNMYVYRDVVIITVDGHVPDGNVQLYD